MATDSQADVHPPRLNPFAFPSDTDFRFVLLIISIVGVSLFFFLQIYFHFNLDQFEDNVLYCTSMSEEKHYNDPFVQNMVYQQCRAPVERETALWRIGGVAVLLAVGGLIYWIFPVWKIWRNQLVPLSDEDSSELVAYLHDLCREAGLSISPVFMLNPLNTASDALTFGRSGRYYVELKAGLVTLFYTDKPAFRSVMLHEMAHIRNADVDKTYFTIAVVWAFLIAGLLPYVIWNFGVIRLAIFANSIIILALVLLIYLTRNAVLRSREIYADVRAYVCDGPAGALGRLLETPPRLKRYKWLVALQTHPDPSERRKALVNTDKLFRLGFWDAFGTGIAAAIAFPNVTNLLRSLLTATPYLNLAQTLAAALVFTPLAIAVVGLGAWRATFAALMRGKTLSGAKRLGFGLGSGILFGQVFDFYLFLDIYYRGINFDFNFFVLWSILLLASLALFFQWIVTWTSEWLELAVSFRSPRKVIVTGMVAAGIILTIWLGQLFLIKDTKESLGFFQLFLFAPSNLNGLIYSFNFFLAILLTLMGPPAFTILGLIILWALPLGSWFWRSRIVSTNVSDLSLLTSESVSSWAFLDETSQRSTLQSRPPLQINSALKIGLTGGLIFCLLLLIIRILCRFGLPETTRTTDEYKLISYFLINLTPSVLMQAGVAVFAASRIERLSLYHGLFAAFVSGCIMTVGILGLNLLFGGIIDADFVWMIFSQVIILGTLLVIIVLGIFALIRWIRGLMTVTSQ